MEKKSYGLLGKTLNHSFSAAFFTEKFEKEGISASYENIELATAEEVEKWLQENRNKFSGVNVTIPYKSVVIPFLDELSEEAAKIQAVNTIQFKGGKLIGHNTDAYGFQQSIKPFLRNVHERALILGTGGASKAVAHVLKNLGITVNYLSRTSNTDAGIFAYDQANEYMVNAFKLIVNTTPLGTFPNEEEMPEFPIHHVGEDHFVVDLIYNPAQTKLLRIAKENGADTLNGLSMLQQQALKAWEIWTSED